MGKALPGVYELRYRDANCWYRLRYIHLEGLVYVLHCLTKTTNQTAQSDINIARDRLKLLNAQMSDTERDRKHVKGTKQR